MQLNPEKCEVLIVDFSRIKRLGFEFKLLNVNVRIVENAMVLGVKINKNLSWDEHISISIKKANKSIYIIKKLFDCGFDSVEALHAYTTYIRPHLEYCSVVWGSCLNSKLTNQLERCQKRVLSAILRKRVDRENYQQVLKDVGIPSLEERRSKCLIKFGRGLFISRRFRQFLPNFITTESDRVLRSRKGILCMPTYKNNRYKLSTIPSIINLINTEYIEKETIFGWSRSDAEIVEGKL